MICIENAYGAGAFLQLPDSMAFTQGALMNQEDLCMPSLRIHTSGVKGKLLLGLSCWFPHQEKREQVCSVEGGRGSPVNVE